MRRREFITLAGASVVWPFAARAQEPGRTYRLGFLEPGLVDRDAPTTMAFFNELQRLGFVENRNLAIEWRAYGQHVDLIPQYAAELVNAAVKRPRWEPYARKPHVRCCAGGAQQ